MEHRSTTGTVEQFVEKLWALRRFAIRVQPDPDKPYDPMFHEYDEEQTKEQINTLYARAKIIFARFGIVEGAESIQSIFEKYKDDLLFIIDEPPWYAGEYLMIRELVDVIDNYLFAYSNKEEDVKQSSLGFSLLYELLSNIEKTFTITRQYPSNEAELHQIIESILICSFPRLIHKPAIATVIKNFIPDTGIPEARTLIEYKFINRKEQLQPMVDEIFADLSGYKHPDWDHIIYIFYETERFLPESKWKELLLSFKQTSVVVIKGIAQPKRPK